MHLERYGRAARVASNLLSLRPRDAAVMYVRARALFKDDELTDALLVATQLLGVMQKTKPQTTGATGSGSTAGATPPTGAETSGSSSTADTAVGTPTSASSVGDTAAAAAAAGPHSSPSTPSSSAPPSPSLSASASTSASAPSPLDLPVPTRAQADALLAQINAAMPGYRSRQLGLRHQLIAFMMGVHAGDREEQGAGEGEEEEEEEQTPSP
jgi:hypothetical protein